MSGIDVVVDDAAVVPDAAGTDVDGRVLDDDGTRFFGFDLEVVGGDEGVEVEGLDVVVVVAAVVDSVDD